MNVTSEDLTIRPSSCSSPRAPAPIEPKPNRLLNGEVHDWYRIVHGYSDHLVSGLLAEFALGAHDLVLDPFCGTGTTLVECMKKGIDSLGIDANPSSYFASRVKTNWNLNPKRLRSLCDELRSNYKKFIRRTQIYAEDPTYLYLENAGFIARGWISLEPARKTITVKSSIRDLQTSGTYKNAFMLALMSELVHSASNVKFGPELYCSTKKDNADGLDGGIKRVEAMAKDLEVARSDRCGYARVLLGDARECSRLIVPIERRKFSAVICSPPYPTEHDYTRNARLELALIEAVTGKESLRSIKRQMIRSHTKNIYKGDNDRKLVADVPQVENIACELDRKVADLQHGFGRYYPIVIREYFGGMRRHFESVKRRLRKGAICAYVVGDQCSYQQVFVPTAVILSTVAEKVGFETVEIRRWRGRRSTTGQKRIDENVLILRNST